MSRSGPGPFRAMALAGAIAFFGATLPGNAQTWMTVASSPPQNKVFMLSGTTGWMVGPGGAIRSTTTGTTWSVPVYPTTQTLHAVWAADANNAWAVGSGGTIVKWNGTSWFAQTSGTGNTLYGVWGSSSGNVWAVGTGGVLLRWDGIAWAPQSSGTTDDLLGIWAAGPSDAWAVGANGRIVRWDGSAWASAASNTMDHLLGVWGTGSSSVWAVGFGGTVLQWNGSVWAAQNSGTSGTLFGIGGSDGSNIWAVGAAGAIVKYDGSNWTAQSSGTTADLSSVAAPSSTKAFAMGLGGGYLQWNGSAWSQGSGLATNLHAVWGADATSVWAVGDGGSIFLWSGTGWSAQPSCTNSRLNGIGGAAANAIWAVGDNGTIAKWDGTSWNNQTSNTTNTLYGIWAADANNAWAVGKSGTILRWNGSTWTAQSSPTTNALHAVWGVDANAVWAAGGGGTILKWNGTTWTAQSSGTTAVLNALHGTSSGNVWAAGANGVIRLWNGSTWSGGSVGTNTLGAVWAASSSAAWAAGDGGTVLFWNGSTWTPQTSGAGQPFNGLWGSGATNLYAVGDWGTTARFGSTPPLPSVTTPATSGITPTSVSLFTSVSPNGTSTTVTFEYGTTTGYGSTATAWENPFAANGTARAQLSGLAGGTLYHFRARASSSAGTVVSADRTFTTPPIPVGAPAAATRGATLVSSTSATLNGTVNPSGSNTSVIFELGTTTNYNLTVGPSPSSATGTADVSLSASRGGLTAGTTYHYRLRATNSQGLVYGADQTFTTPPQFFPAASTAPATNLTATGATLRGFVSANGGPATTAVFEYGTDTTYGSTLAVAGSFTSPSFAAVGASLGFSTPNVTYHYRLKASNTQGVTYGQDLTFTTPDPHDATLSGITVSTGTLSPAFSSGTTTYTMTVPYETTGLTLTPTANQPIATIDITGNPTVLNVGTRDVTLFVTAGDHSTTQTYHVLITRLGPTPGSLDFSLNGNGKVATALSTPGGFGYRSVIQPDGRVLVAGYATVGGTDRFALARYNPDGSLDATFNSTGYVTTALGSVSDIAFHLALQTDGRIILVGQSSDGTYLNTAIARYLPDGSLDTTFNSTGKLVTSLGSSDDFANGVAVQSDGKIVVVGRSNDGTKDSISVLRLNGDGGPDTSFNATGTIITDLGTGSASASGVTVQGDGKLVVVGSTFDVSVGLPALAVLRYTGNGTLDSTFNSSGIATASLGTFGCVGYAVAVQGDGGILVSGAAQNSTWDAILLRFTSAGLADSTFGNNGSITTSFGTGNDWGNALALQSDGKILLAGNSDSPHVMTLQRFLGDGSTDNSFGTQGKITASFGETDCGAYGVAVQGDGQIIVSGYTGNFSSYRFALVRCLGDGPAISVRQSPGSGLFDTISTSDFGRVQLGSSVTLGYTIQNTGLAPLTGLGLSLDGTGFTLGTAPAAPLAALESTTFTVTFSPASIGAKSAVLHIPSNVAGNNATFDVTLTGTGYTLLDDWRELHFPGSTQTTGPGADTAAPLGDGIPNLMKFATGMDPGLPGTTPGAADASGDNILFTYVRSKEAVADGVLFTVEWSDTLAAGSWSSAGVSETPTIDQGDTEVIVATIPAAGATRRFVRLRVTR